MKVYGITGLPGSGKSIISRLAKNEGVHIISMGDIVRKEAEKQNCSSGVAAVNLRKKYGDNVIAERCVEEIQNHSRDRLNNQGNTLTRIYTTKNQKQSQRKFKRVEQDVYIIEGIRSPFEVNIFRRNFKNFKVIAIHSSPETRFNRLKRRKRSDDSTDFKTFLERDRRELKFGIGNVIATADFMLINDGPIPIFKNVVRGLIDHEIKPKRKPYKNHNKNKNKPNRKHRKNPNNYKKHNKQNPNNRNKKDFRNKRRY
ncbi:AAA family ATPase [Methanosphaera sp. BMS]|uniref:AAA family ATPase n=1 Tax=Methanosphaera sp. BMS TaxID=1789762 RepID=UPI000DD47F19|nr:AAA family ATPase [Methanosphaera sp. BMS]